MTWQQGDKVVCEVGFEFDNPVWTGRKFQMRPGRLAQLVEINEGTFRVGWFDFGTGQREGFVEHSQEGLEHYWRRCAVQTPVAPRAPRPMVISYAPEDPHKRRTKLHIGYWAESSDPMKDSYEKRGVYLPWPGDYLDPEWNGHERNMVTAHLRDSPDLARHRQHGQCRICGVLCGSTDKTDGTYVWPVGLAHYVETHSLRPPPEFVHHIIRYNNVKKHA